MRRKLYSGLAVGFSAVMVYLIFFHVDPRDRRLSGEAAALVHDEVRSGRNVRYLYRYAVAGRTYEGTSLTKNVSIGKGKPAKACYDPDDPSQSMLKPMGSRCGSGKG
jgi:hypothetical protein